MIALPSILAAYESILRLMDPEPITKGWIALVGGLIGFAGNELVAICRIRVGNKIDPLGLRWAFSIRNVPLDG
jgi:divalent metal cation (Fe/Co/Zn/Cd) transporter